MRRILLVLSFLGIGFGSACVGRQCHAQETPGKEVLKPDQTLSTSLPAKVKTVKLVSSMLDVDVLQDSKVMGRICDVAFDLETGQLALVVVKATMAGGDVSDNKPSASQDQSDKQVEQGGDATPNERFILLPFVDFDQQDVFEWEDDQTISRLPKALTRAIAQKTYSDVNQDIYWSRYLTELKEELNSKFDDRNFELATFSLLRRRGIVDSNGESIGKLVDFAIESGKGDIIYCVIECTDKKHRAIPLGAFVMPENNYRWTIELSSSQIFDFPGFDLEAPPTHIDRGWAEYVAVRYGRDGLQEVAKGEHADPLAD